MEKITKIPADFKANPNAVLNQSEGEAVAILKSNAPYFYAVPPSLFEAMFVAMSHVKAGEMKYALAIAADTSQGAPSDALEFSAAAGAAPRRQALLSDAGGDEEPLRISAGYGAGGGGGQS